MNSGGVIPFDINKKGEKEYYDLCLNMLDIMFEHIDMRLV